MSPPTPQGTFKSASERIEGRRENPAPYRCSFHPERKTFLVSTCSQLQLLSCWLLLSSLLEHPCLSSYNKARCKLWVFAVWSLTYLGPLSGHRIAPDQGEKCGREDRGEPELRECGSAGAPGGGRPRAALTHSVWAIMDSACSCTGDFIPKFASQYPICSYTTKDFSVPRQ